MCVPEDDYEAVPAKELSDYEWSIHKSLIALGLGITAGVTLETVATRRRMLNFKSNH